MSARSKARKRALDVLYESEAKGADPRVILAARISADDPPVADFTVELVEGVVANLTRIDALLAAHSTGWSVDRMPAVDRAILRLGVFELLWRDDVPDGVAVDEAVGLARQLSTDESPAFVNGLLGQILVSKPAPGARSSNEHSGGRPNQ